MLITVLKPTEGKATILGGDIAKQSMDVRGSIGVVPKEYIAIAQMPSWLQAVANVNPISYTIDAVRRLMVFSNGYGHLAGDFAFVGIFAVVVTVICVVLSWEYLNK